MIVGLSLKLSMPACENGAEARRQRARSANLNATVLFFDN
jgi:hypothetical protein